MGQGIVTFADPADLEVTLALAAVAGLPVRLPLVPAAEDVRRELKILLARCPWVPAAVPA